MQPKNQLCYQSVMQTSHSYKLTGRRGSLLSKDKEFKLSFVFRDVSFHFLLKQSKLVWTVPKLVKGQERVTEAERGVQHGEVPGTPLSGHSI